MLDAKKILKRFGLTEEDLCHAECYYLSDDQNTLIAEYPKTWQHTRLPGRPHTRKIDQSSMHDGKRSLIVSWR